MACWKCIILLSSLPLAAGMFPSLLFIFVEVGCGRGVSCGFEAFSVEWIPITDFNKLCTTGSGYVGL